MMFQPRALHLILAAACTLAGCSSRSSAPNEKGAGGNSTDTTGAARTGCNLDALGLGAATSVPAWKPPAGCTARGGTGNLAIAIATEAEFAEMFGCAEGVTSGIDFGRHQLILQHRSLSPAATGGEIVDDGTTVTYLTHFRIPCPDERPPMPIGYAVTYLLPAGAARTFAESSCTLGGQPRCR